MSDVRDPNMARITTKELADKLNAISEISSFSVLEYNYDDIV